MKQFNAQNEDRKITIAECNLLQSVRRLQIFLNYTGQKYLFIDLLHDLSVLLMAMALNNEELPPAGEDMTHEST